MFFTPNTPKGNSTASEGTVIGWRMVNTSGYAGTNGAAFVGSYKFLGTPSKPKQLGSIGNYTGPIPLLGAITTQFVHPVDIPGMANHVWDYIFVMVSEKEMQLTANGRFPRPGVATGVLQKTDSA